MTEIEQTEIETPRLILRPYQSTDLSDVFAYASDPDVTRFLTWNTHKTLDDSQAFLKWVAEVTNSERDRLFFVYAIWSKDHEKVIGSIDFKKTNRFCGQMDYVIGKAYWGHGYTTEAGQGILNWARQIFPEIVRYQAFCQPENIGSKVHYALIL